MKRVIVADNDIDGVSHACILARRGYEVTFYSPNKYILNEALRYKHLTSHYFTRTEFMKLITSGKFSTTERIDTTADALIIPAGTVNSEAGNTNQVLSLIRGVFENRKAADYIILVGANAIGTTTKIITGIMDYCTEVDKGSIIYAGCPPYISGRIPVYSAVENDTVFKLVSKLYGKDYITAPSPEIAEYTTLVKVVEGHILYYFGLQIIFNSEELDTSALDYVTNGDLTLGFENKQIEYVLNYLQHNEKVRSYTARIVNEVMRCRRKVLSESIKNARSMLRRLLKQRSSTRILAVVSNENEQEMVTGLLPQRDLRIYFKHIDDIPISNSVDNILKGFDIVISSVACPVFSRMLRNTDNVYVFDLMRPVKSGFG